MSKEKIIKICDYIIQYGFLAIIFFIPIIFDYSLSIYNSFDLSKAVFFRVILTLILLAYTAKIFIAGKLSYRGSNKIFLFIIFLLASFFISSLFSMHPKQSFWGDFSRQQGFYNFVHYLLFFVLLIFNIKEIKQIKRIITVIIASAFLTTLYGLIQYFNFDPFTWDQSAFNIGRIFSSLGQPNFFGHYLVLILPFSFYALFFMAKRFLVKFLVVLAIIMQLACLIFTYSRAAWLGFLGSVGFFLIIWLVFEWQKRKKIVYVLIGILSVSLIAIIGFSFIKSISQNNSFGANLINRAKSIIEFRNVANRARFYYWKSAIEEVKRENIERLVFGYGPDALADVFVKYYRPDWAIFEVIDTFPDRAHNWLFENLLSLGFLGLASIFLFYFYFIRKIFIFLFNKTAKIEEEIWLVIAASTSLVAYCINNLFSFSLIVGYIYLYLILAILWFFIVVGEPREIKIKLMVISKALILLVLFSVAVLYIYFENVNLVRADYFYAQGKKAATKGDCRGILDNLEQASAYQPAKAFYKERYIFYGINCFSSITDRNNRMVLRDNIIEQIKLIKPQDYQYITRLTLARAYALFGFYVEPADYKIAEKFYLGLIADYPELLASYQDLGRMKMWQKDYDGALNLFKQAEKHLLPLDNPLLNQDHKGEIVPATISLYENMGFSYYRLKDYSAALEYYKRALALDPFRTILYKNLADIYYVQGQIDKAITLNKRGFILSPVDFNWPLALSLLYREKKDFHQAREYLDQALKLAPENAELKKYKEELNK